MTGLEYSRHTVSSCGLCVYVQALIFDRKTHREVLLDINTLFTASKRFFPLIFKIFRFPGSKAPNRPEVSSKIGNFQLDRMWTSPGPWESYCEDGMLKFDPICPRARWDTNMAECQAPWMRPVKPSGSNASTSTPPSDSRIPHWYTDSSPQQHVNLCVSSTGTHKSTCCHPLPIRCDAMICNLSYSGHRSC